MTEARTAKGEPDQDIWDIGNHLLQTVKILGNFISLVNIFYHFVGFVICRINLQNGDGWSSSSGGREGIP